MPRTAVAGAARQLGVDSNTANGLGEVDLAFLIADLSGFTALTETYGSAGGAQVLTRYGGIAERALEPGARLVERAGDELLIADADVARIVRIAVRLRMAIEQEPLFPSVRAGIHAGPVLEYRGGYVGPALSLARQVAAYARAGEILCTEAVFRRAANVGDIEFVAVGPVRLWNVAEPVWIYEVIPPGQRDPGSAVDPVCRMQVRAETAPARLPYKDRTYWFCSFDCASAFAERPDRYAST
ncbi:MAG: YHS domain-containing protein [Candidatus Rokubacteria bacterium]|nr:YHS domain-containing protein [Candidatus Rokubacteria bacterium]